MIIAPSTKQDVLHILLETHRHVCLTQQTFRFALDDDDDDDEGADLKLIKLCILCLCALGLLGHRWHFLLYLLTPPHLYLSCGPNGWRMTV